MPYRLSWMKHVCCVSLKKCFPFFVNVCLLFFSPEVNTIKTRNFLNVFPFFSSPRGYLFSPARRGYFVETCNLFQWFLAIWGDRCLPFFPLGLTCFFCLRFLAWIRDHFLRVLLRINKKRFKQNVKNVKTVWIWPLTQHVFISTSPQLSTHAILSIITCSCKSKQRQIFSTL